MPSSVPQAAEAPVAQPAPLATQAPLVAPPAPSATAPPSLPWSWPSGRGVGFSVDFFGVASADTDVTPQLGVLVPLGGVLALRDRVVLYDGSGADGGAALGDKLEVMVRSPVLLNFVRVYAGGPAVFYGLSGPSARQVDGNWFAGEIDGNWFAGLEVFFGSAWAVRWEAGTSGGAFSTGAGPYVDVGLSLYPF